MLDFEGAADRVMMGLEQQHRALSDYKRQIVAYHEMGHAIVASLLPNTDLVHRVSIVPRGITASRSNNAIACRRSIFIK